MTPLSSTLTTFLLAGPIALLLYFRLRRLFGRQPLAPRRMAFRMVLLSVVAIVMLAQATTAPYLVAAAVGLVLGGALAGFAIVHTKIEATEEGRFYTPNRWIGLGVLALLLGRMASRFIAVQAAMAQPDGANALEGMNRSPLTLAIFFLMATYYVAYYALIMRKSRALASSP